MEIGALPIGCWSIYYPQSLKNLNNLACIRAFPQALHFSFTAISELLEQGFQLTCLETTCGLTLPPLFVIVVALSNTFPLHIFSPHFFLNILLSLSQSSNTSSGSHRRKISFSLVIIFPSTITEKKYLEENREIQ